jgi:hypothetical protein
VIGDPVIAGPATAGSAVADRAVTDPATKPQTATKQDSVNPASQDEDPLASHWNEQQKRRRLRPRQQTLFPDEPTNGKDDSQPPQPEQREEPAS